MSLNTLSAVKQGLALVETFKPLIGAIGGPAAASVASIATAVADTAITALGELEAGRLDLSSEDEAALRRISDTLQTEIEALGADIAATDG